MWFYAFAITVGFIGAVADVELSKWSSALSLSAWTKSALLVLVFMTAFGLVMKVGSSGGYNLSITVTLVLLANVGSFVLWESYQRSALPPLQLAGIALALAAAACFELGRTS
jgi:hypothetical protein